MSEPPGTGTRPVFTCPCCAATSPHPDDIAGGYCARCHWQTGDPGLGPAHAEAACGLRAARHPFTDLVSGAGCELVIPLAGRAGIAHPGCAALAGLAVELDAFYCPSCRWNGRVSGAWCTGLIRAR